MAYQPKIVMDSSLKWSEHNAFFKFPYNHTKQDTEKKPCIKVGMRLKKVCMYKQLLGYR